MREEKEIGRRDRSEGGNEQRENTLHDANLQTSHTHTHSMLVRCGADADTEDKNKQVPSFLAQRCQALECRQIILQHLKDRAQLLSKQAVEVRKGEER